MLSIFLGVGLHRRCLRRPQQRGVPTHRNQTWPGSRNERFAQRPGDRSRLGLDDRHFGRIHDVGISHRIGVVAFPEKTPGQWLGLAGYCIDFKCVIVRGAGGVGVKSFERHP